MKILIYGAGSNGRIALRILKEKYQVNEEILGFYDTNFTGFVEGYCVLSQHSIPHDTRIVIAINDFDIAFSVCMSLKTDGFYDIWWFPYLKTVLGRDFWEEQCIKCMKWEYPILRQVEMHIMDACNLNCRGCTHFSPIFDMNLPDYDSRISDVKKIKNKFAHIAVFYILGGEPLLNPHLDKYVCSIRELLPYTELIIVTNGILIPKIRDKFLTCIKDNNVKLSISEYLPTHDMIQEIRARLDGLNIFYEIRPFSEKQKFNLPLSLSVADSKYRKCISNGCITIWNGKIARCPTLMYIEQFNKYFQQKLPSRGIIDLDSKISGDELVTELKKDVPLCKHCISHTIEWSACHKNVLLSDFAIEKPLR